MSVLGPLSYQLKLENGKIMKRHIDHLRQRPEDLPQSPQHIEPHEDSSYDFESITSEGSNTPLPEPTSEVSVCRYPQRQHRPPDRYGYSQN